MPIWIMIIVALALFILVVILIYFALQHNEAKEPKAGENLVDFEVRAPDSALVVQPRNIALFVPGFSDGDGGGALELGAADTEETEDHMPVLLEVANCGCFSIDESTNDDGAHNEKSEHYCF